MLTLDVITIVLVGGLLLLNVFVLDYATQDSDNIDNQDDSIDELSSQSNDIGATKHST